ncbi:PAS domain S-box protein [Marinobacter sp.]|uniref:PAS domain-containing sensor histidine kinase n=1 Tax=Marinobacter sp. TaxID=50741 RepID=UPI003561F004
MTELNNRDAVYWCLILALGLCLVGHGMALSVNLFLLLVDTPSDVIYPVGGPLSLLAGGLCLALAFASRWMSRIMALLLILVSIIQFPLALANTDLVQAELPKTGILPGLPAIVILGCIGYLMAARHDQTTPLVKAISAATMAGGAINLFAASLGLPAWARLTTVPDLGPATALFLMILGAVLMLVPRLYQVNYREQRKPVLWVGIVGILITVTSWYLARNNHNEEMQRQAELIASQTSESIQAFHRNELATVARLGERVQAYGGTLPEHAWQQEVASYFRDLPHLQMLALLDHRQQIIELEVRDSDSRFWLSDQFGRDEFRAWLGHDHAQPTPHTSRVYRGPGRQLSIFLAAPVQFADGRSWTLLALTSVDQALQWLDNRQTAGMVVDVTSGGNTLYRTNNLSGADRLVRANASINLDHALWRLTVSEPLTGQTTEDYATETLILFGGLALTVLMMLSRLLGAMATGRNQRLEQANSQLQRHLKREQALRETNERIVNFSSDLLCTIDSEGYFRFVSPSSRRILGYSPEELEGRPVRDFVLAEDWAASAEVVEQVRTRHSAPVPQFRNRYRHRDGRTVTLDWKARISSEDGTLFAIGRDMTSELKAEELAQQREAFFSLTPEMFCIVADNRFVEVNQAFLTNLGYSREELLGNPYLNIILPEHHQAVVNAVEQLLDGATIYDLEIEVLNREGKQRWLRLNAAMYAEKIYCSARDITGEKETQRQLQEKERLLSMAENTGRLGGWVVDVATGKTTWSSAIYEIHDMEPGEVPDLTDALDYYTAETRPLVEESVRLASELGLPFDIEARIRTVKGRLRWVRAIGQAVRDDHGRIVKLQGAFQDVSASKEASEQIRRLAERQSRIFESITDAFFTLDRSWHFTFMNGKCEELLQRSRSDALGETLWEAFPETIGSEFEEHYRDALTTGETASFEAHFEPLELWVEVKAYPSEEGLAVYFRSINERKKAEQALQATLAELERSNRELQDFAFVASHDLQEPLRKIQTFGDRLMRNAENLGEKEQDYLKRMQSAASRMQTLIMDLLTYSRVSTRGQPFRDCDLNRIIEEVQQDLESAITSSGAVIRVSDLPPVQGDPSQLRQVMQNLLSNAIKFRRADVTPEILVYAENISAKGWTLVVSDNGTGFDPKYVDRLFQPFQRLHSKNDYAGTGIGLAIVRKIVSRHNGIIVADSQPGEGATFRIHFTSQAAPSEPAGDTPTP